MSSNGDDETDQPESVKSGVDSSDRVCEDADSHYEHPKDSTNGDLGSPGPICDTEKQLEIDRLQGDLVSLKGSFEQLRNENTDLRTKLTNAETHHLTLNKQIKCLQKEVKDADDALASHDAAAKCAVASLQAELKSKCEALGKQLNDMKREKENLVLKFAQSEAENLKVQRVAKDHDAKSREAHREKELILSRARVLKAERDKLAADLTAKTQESSAIIAELKHFKDEHSSDDVRAEFAEKRLKAELENHKDTKKKLELAKEETELIRKNCADIVKKYQESEEIKSNSLDSKLKQAIHTIEEKKHEQIELREDREKMQKEIEALKSQLKEAVSEKKTLREKLRCLEAERLCQEEAISHSKDTTEKTNREIDHLRAQKRLGHAAMEEAGELKQKLTEKEKKLKEVQAKCTELESEAEGLKKKETELLEFTQRVSDRHAALQSDSLTMSSQLEAATKNLEESQKLASELQRRLDQLETSSTSAASASGAEVERLTVILEEKRKTVEDLTVQLEDERSEIRTIKKKHASVVKDLTRQLAQARKKLENGSLNAPAPDALSAGSRASSTSSLEQANGAATLLVPHPEDTATSYHETYRGRSAANELSCDVTPEIKMVEPDRQALIEKIVKLQRDRGRKNEKIDFLQEHVRQLTDEVQKKNKLLQFYFLREESGSIVPEKVDIHKAVLARKGGIMASMYNAAAPPTDSTLTLPISLEINRKLQAVLEDTILKNMTLKDNMTTLGEEIARLSQENRQMHLQEDAGAGAGAQQSM